MVLAPGPSDTAIHAARAADGRNGALIYQARLARMAPPAGLAAKRQRKAGLDQHSSARLCTAATAQRVFCGPPAVMLRHGAMVPQPAGGYSSCKRVP